MNRFRRTKRMHAIVLLATAWSLCACGTTTASQSAAPPHPTNVPVAAEYHAQLRGHWMPEDMACTSPINYDSDRLVVIDKDRLGHYEDANKHMEVRKLSSELQAWSIQSLLKVGGDGFDTPISEIFGIGGRKLGIAGTGGGRG